MTPRPCHFALALGATLAAAGASLPEDAPSPRALASGADCVLWGHVAETREVGAGSLHAVHVRRVLRGEGPGESAVLFTFGAGVADAPRLAEGEDAVLAVRWIDPRVDPWPARLEGGAELAARAGARLGLLGPGKIPAQGRASVADEVAAWIRAARDVEGLASRDEALLVFLDHPDPAFRAATIEELASIRAPFEPEAEARARMCLERDASGPLDGACASAWVCLVEARSLAEVDAALGAVVSGSEEAAREAPPRPAPEERPRLAERFLRRIVHREGPGQRSR
ncbi:MAG: hypothetical protein HY721_06065 [Planctomycetes bacterium]|nr:hypothetical protein [Planctomycetota bacterium]